MASKNTNIQNLIADTGITKIELAGATLQRRGNIIVYVSNKNQKKK